MGVDSGNPWLVDWLFVGGGRNRGRGPQMTGKIGASGRRGSGGRAGGGGGVGG